MLGNKRIPMNLFMEFIGIYLSNGDYDDNTIKIYHKNESVCESISKLLDSIGFDYSIDVKDYGLKAFVIVNSDLNEYIKSLGDSKNKCIPPILKNQSKENLEMLFDWFLIGSEVITNDLPQSEQLTLDLDEIRFKIGFFADVYLHEEKISIGKEHYKGTVMCVEVPNHVWCCMCNSNIHWTKNCNHPAETVIDLDRIAINIIELHWEGNTLVGKMEIPVSEGFRRFGIISTRADQVAYLILSDLLIGVSSRGLGSVEKVMGKLIVKDDYEIICWDVVSDPSTPNAYIVKNKEQLSLYIEDNAKKGNVLIEKLEKFNNWLTLRD